MDIPAAAPDSLRAAVMAATLIFRRGGHLDTGESCSIYSRTDKTRILWIPDDTVQSMILQDGIEGEGQWFVASREPDGWQVSRDYWDAASDESAEEILFIGDRVGALNRLIETLLD